MMLALEIAARAAVSASGVPTLRWHDYSAQLKVSQLETADTSFDTIIVGTSMAQQGLLPEGFANRSTYNAGLNGGVPTVMEPWLIDHVLERLAGGGTEPKPETVIWGLSSLDFSLAYGNATIEAFDDAPSTGTGPLAHLDQMVADRSEFVANRSVLRDPSALAGQERQDSVERYEKALGALGSAGERRDYTTSVSLDRANEVRKRISPYALDVDDIAAVVRTIEDLEELGVEVILVELPVPPRFLELYENTDSHAGFQRALAALSTELDVELISATGGYDNSDFVDYTHLNEASAHRFTATVNAELD